MKRAINLLLIFPLALAISIPAFARSRKKGISASPKEHTYYGDISDSNCGAHHKMPANPRQCTLECIKHGAKYVFVTRGRALMVENQNDPKLEQYAGEHVKVTGTKTSDHKGITVAKIVKVIRRRRKPKA
ncbi:MAG TPA: hypothetical protein VNG91_08495 [Terriglobia bacterium]|nr:hypothetical protein [Terriglobia bacterium]